MSEEQTRSGPTLEVSADDLGQLVMWSLMSGLHDSSRVPSKLVPALAGVLPVLPADTLHKMRTMLREDGWLPYNRKPWNALAADVGDELLRRDTGGPRTVIEDDGDESIVMPATEDEES